MTLISDCTRMNAIERGKVEAKGRIAPGHAYKHLGRNKQGASFSAFVAIMKIVRLDRRFGLTRCRAEGIRTRGPLSSKE
jgi:hypothetical protein